MYKFVLVVLAVAASSLADTQVLKTMGANLVPANAAYVAPLSGYATGYAAHGAVYPQYPHYQQYQQYPAGYAGYTGYSGYAYPGYQGLVSPMSYAPVAAAAAYPYASPVVYQQKHVAAAPANAYSVL